MRVRRVGVLGGAAILLACGVLLIPSARTRLLRSAGWALVSEDPIERADVIVLTVDARDAGVLEAADLVHAGVAGRVGVFDDSPDPSDAEVIRRGLPYTSNAERESRMLRALGVTDVKSLGTVVGTESEIDLLFGWCDRMGVHTVVVVALKDHSRRVRRVLLRTMRGHAVKAIVRAARFSTFDPDNWWRTRGGIRTEIVETEKLWLDVVRHPFS
jgi:hypothetical protein